jgi:SAM-dependent MidA family methyltransferase
VTPLERALRDRIRAEGPISVEAYMEACNTYYYATRDPLGAGGDFTTAPEISQMFGEVLGAALSDTWLRAAAPGDAIYAELGPGRGTLAGDALRALRAVRFPGAAHFVETSPVLRAIQRRAIAGAHWYDRVEDLPANPLLLVANEFLDALPVRQFVDGVERRVQILGGGLAFDRDGQVVEQSPARDDAVAAMATKICISGGVALIIDYGHERSGAGDSLQAVHAHRYAPVLERPGEQDVTAQVDFEAVARAARAAGAAVSEIITQGQWLTRLGIDARARSLMRANPDRRLEIQTAQDRLVNAEQMGSLFKVIALYSPDWPPPPGFA